MREGPPPPRLLSGLTPHQRELALERAERRDFAANQLIVSIGKPATRLFQLTKGTARYYRVTNTGDEVLLWWLASEDILGVGALLAEPLRYIGTAQAVEDCEMLVWKRESIRSIPTVYELMTANALHIAMHAVAAYADRIVGLTTETAEQRLRRTLLQLARRTGKVRPEGVDVTITNQDLGGLADVGLFTTSRVMKKWERQGVIDKGRGRVRIFSPENLFSGER
jgi:CRP-like cAMP-binding protein